MYICFYFIATLKHVAKTVAHVDLNDHLINVIFTIFDENREFIFYKYILQVLLMILIFIHY